MAHKAVDFRADERSASVFQIARVHAAALVARRRLRGVEQRLDIDRSPLAVAAACGVSLDEWQQRALTSTAHDILLLVTRQGGKGEVATMLCLSTALSKPGATILIVSRADRQAKRLLKRIRRRYAQLPDVPPPVHESSVVLELANGSEILAVPGSEETIRGIEAVDLLVIDEAALVSEELFAAVYPMLASVDGRCIAMTTPRGKRGWFYNEWISDDTEWHREVITWREIPRFSPSWVERTRRRFGEWRWRQEFEVEFVDQETQFFASDLVASAVSSDVTTFGLPTLAA